MTFKLQPSLTLPIFNLYFSGNCSTNNGDNNVGNRFHKRTNNISPAAFKQHYFLILAKVNSYRFPFVPFPTSVATKHLHFAENANRLFVHSRENSSCTPFSQHVKLGKPDVTRSLIGSSVLLSQSNFA